MFFFDINWCRISIVNKTRSKKEVFTEPPFRIKTKIQWASLNYLIMALDDDDEMMMMMMMMMVMMMMLLMMLLLMIESIIILILMNIWWITHWFTNALTDSTPSNRNHQPFFNQNNSWIAKWSGLHLFFLETKRGVTCWSPVPPSSMEHGSPMKRQTTPLDRIWRPSCPLEDGL